MLIGPDALLATVMMPPLTTATLAAEPTPTCRAPLTTSCPPTVPAVIDPLSSVTVDAVICPAMYHAAAENAIVSTDPLPLIAPPPADKTVESPAVGTVEETGSLELLQLLATSNAPPPPKLAFRQVYIAIDFDREFYRDRILHAHRQHASVIDNRKLK
ncbi:MAG: hypothetical protein M3N26_07680 [Pseudomonadota bacterium]|nr:hypothetical protein [Pseudomonadota bacterium]